MCWADWWRDFSRDSLFLENQAFQLEEKSDYAGAAKLYERALALAPKVYGERHESTADLQDSLASQYAELGCFEEAETLYLRARIRARLCWAC